MFMPRPWAAPRRVDSGAAVIVGGGIAGVFCALKLAPKPVTLLLRGALGQMASSSLAQGGIAAALGPGDSAELHARDTLIAGAGIAEPAIVSALTAEAPDRIADLIGLGARFDRGSDGLLLGREAAHSAHRIVHAGGDRSGERVMAALIEAVRAAPSITIVENCEALELASAGRRIVGAYARKLNDPGAILLFTAPAVVLATGGLGQLYQVTTNPKGVAGEGLGLAAQAGAVLADLEFVQFHPTAIATGGDPAPLATEALRGAGATLVDAAGSRFMPAVHEWAELAPRDVVARAIWRQLKTGRGALLDARSAIGPAFPERFPTVHALCRSAGIDPTREAIPVAPAAHYHMGGVRTDAAGRTSLVGLWACGEVASTGVHGANRLASNSLLEGLVFGARVAADIAAANSTASKHAETIAAPRVTGWDEKPVAPLRTELRRIMSERVGVVREEDSLRVALREIAALEQAAGGRSAAFANSVLAAKLVTVAALRRRESLGAHFREDHPEAGPHPARSFLTLADAQAALTGLDGVETRELVEA